MSENKDYEVKEFCQLSDEELEGVTGGLVVSYADGYRNLVIDDADGMWVEEVYNDLDLALEDARRGGYGDTVIHVAEDDYAVYADWLRKSSGRH